VTALAAGDQRRLLQLVALAASPYDGEALAALRKAQAIASAHSMTLPEALLAGAVVAIDLQRITALETDAFQRGYAQGRAETTAEGTLRTWREFSAECLAKFAFLLNPWEQQFLRNYATRGWATPTPKQLPVLQRIAAKTGVRAP
jgi:hypothetical protein